MQVLMKRYITILNLILTTAAIYFAVSICYKIIGLKLDSGLPHPAAGKRYAAVETSIPDKSVRYGPIRTQNRFEVKTAKLEKTDPNAGDALKKTRPELKLWGTVLRPGDRSYAVIESNDGKQGLYRVGDTVSDATVKLILRGKIVLSINGKDEILELEKMPSGTTSEPDRPGRHQNLQRIHVERSQIDNAVQNIGQLSRQVNIRPHFEDGKPSGLILSRIQPDSIIDHIGLMNGDVIVGANGKRIESVEHALAAYESLKSSSNIRLEIKRKGRNRSIDYVIE